MFITNASALNIQTVYAKRWFSGFQMWTRKPAKIKTVYIVWHGTFSKHPPIIAIFGEEDK